ncbi:MAG: pyridoxal 5'-phosphate synthase glutaminase subunit PdxT [Lachnospiraceae bacterium]|nr:pyridoxal 5'-phosphate synthase glutaminase subunit PdxT [Lachnospiraceae bacterium]
MKIGILALQGAFIEHKTMLETIAQTTNRTIECVELRQKNDLADIDGLILPGGESTVQGQLLRKLHMLQPLKELIGQGLPVLATCAGLILLAEKLENDTTSHLCTLPITVKRNAYGRQLGSFKTTSDIGIISNFPMVFIRGPYITQISPDVTPLVSVNGNLVGVEYHNQIGLAFHPEMTDDPRLHLHFLDKVAQRQ